ncbi:MAG: peptidoglycan-N-acetylglucosamine deacetylase [Verrucomicrobiota bacterium]|jgi:peptidoglycan/xylan/chitin deacetylase (PgdA/CDA1 family)
MIATGAAFAESPGSAALFSMQTGRPGSGPCNLRWKSALLDTPEVFPISDCHYMFSRRSFALLSFCFLFLRVACGQTPSPGPVEKSTVAPPRAVLIAPASPAQPQISFNSVHVDGPYIALTFDDGPSATLTPKLLDLLAAHHMKATFFVVGQNAADHPEILKRAVREGHEIANHSWSHPILGKMSDEAVRRELQKTDDAIAAAIGKRPTLLRPPYGSITAHQKKWIHDDFGYRIIIWDVDPLDWKRPGPSVVTSRILKETHAGSIVLAHDIHAPTLEAMPATFDQLERKGFKSVTVTELLAMATPLPPKPSPTPRVSPAPVISPGPSATPPAVTSTPGG